MFLSRRTTQEEYFDSERPAAEVADFFQSLGRVNRFFDFAEPFRNLLPPLLGDSQCRSLSLLDVGAGDGSLGRAIEAWARERGWTWRVVNLDCSLSALQLNSGGLNIAGSAVQLPFHTGSFDVVVASQMVHHLADPQVILLLQEAWRVARRTIMICDLHRNLALYLALRTLFLFQRHRDAFRSDAFVSVRRGWRVGELLELARMAGLSNAAVKLRFGARIILHAQHDRRADFSPQQLPNSNRL